MKKKEVLEQLDSLIDNSRSFITDGCDSIWEEDIEALEIAKKAVNKEYRFQFLCMLVTLAITIVVFGSFVGMTYFMYYR